MDENITFHVGDIVTWNARIQEAIDHPVWEFPLVADHPRRKFGPGPFTVVEVQTIPIGLLACGHYRGDPEHSMCRDFDTLDKAEGKHVEDSDQTARDAAGHHQYVTIRTEDGCDEQLTGAYFEIAQAAEKTSEESAFSQPKLTEGMIRVRFEPCGHVCEMHQDVVHRLPGATLDLIVSTDGDLPVFHSQECPECGITFRGSDDEDQWPEVGPDDEWAPVEEELGRRVTAQIDARIRRRARQNGLA